MMLLSILVAATTLATQCIDDLGKTEQRVYDAASTIPCRRNYAPTPEKKAIIYALLVLEQTYEIPADARGISVAAACIESGYRPLVHGDFKKAVGLLQFWPWAIKSIRKEQEVPTAEPRLDWRASAKFWLKHFKRQLHYAERLCKGKKYGARDAVLAAAEANTVRTVICLERKGKACIKKKFRCGEQTKHWKYFLSIRDATEAQIAKDP